VNPRHEEAGNRLFLKRHPTYPIFTAWRVRGFATRVLLFALESVLGIVSLLLVAALARWSGWPAVVTVLIFMLIVTFSAMLSGVWQALVVSLAAVAAQIGLIPRQAPFAAVTLPLFVAAALVVGRLSARAAAEAKDAASRSGQLQDLYEFTRRTLEMNLDLEPGPQLAELVHEIFALEAVALFDAELHEVYSAGYWNVDPGELARNVYYFGTTDDDPESGLGRRVLRLGTAPIGSLVVRGTSNPLTNNAIAALLSLSFDRYRAFANESRIEIERRHEQLRSTVLDSLAHAYKTPLTAIRAASTGLSEMGHLSPAQAELVALIDEQAGQLGSLTTRLLSTARLDSGEVAIRTTPVGVAPLIEEVVTSLGERLASMKVALDIPDDELVLCCDRQMMVMLLTQYIDNACKYSILGTTITIRAVKLHAEVVFSVHSFGPAIPLADRERIFDRYYRSASHANRAAGTGIGLSVAKRIALIHGGSVWVTGDEVEGTTFFAAIPASTRKRCS
jgi:two-component system sensor histidine kinase KdpD